MIINTYELAEKDYDKAWDTHSSSRTECQYCKEMVVPIRITEKGYEYGYCPKCRHCISSCEIDKGGLPVNWWTK